MSYWNLFIVNQIEKNMKEVLNEYLLGDLKGIKQIKSGIINSTFIIDTSKGKFILQEIRDKNMTHDHASVEDYIETRFPVSGIKVPNQLRTRNGELHAENDGKIYRILDYIENQELESLTPKICYNLGESLAKFHLQTSDFNESLKYSIPNFHDTPAIIDRLKEIKFEYGSTKKWESVSNYYNQIVDEVEKFYLPDLHSRLIHGDPKWQNFLYDHGEVTAIVDLETLMYGDELIDIGDALRSWSKDKEYNFIKENFEFAIEGYMSNNKTVQKELIPKATALITLELSARFLIDYFEQTYFRSRKIEWDSEENFRRLENQMKFYSDMKSQLKL